MDKIWPPMQMFKDGITDLEHIRENLNDLMIKQKEASELADALMNEIARLQDEVERVKREGKIKC